jgi:hypothetical protein
LHQPDILYYHYKPTTLTINGNFTSSGNLNFNIYINGNNVFIINGDAIFNGGSCHFDFIAYKPHVGEYWDFLFADTITGFETLTFSSYLANFAWEIESFPTWERLVITAQTPIPGAFILFGSGLSLLAICRRRKLKATN